MSENIKKICKLFYEHLLKEDHLDGYTYIESFEEWIYDDFIDQNKAKLNNEPSEQRVASNGIIVGRCKCNTIVVHTDKYCLKCGIELKWNAKH